MGKRKANWSDEALELRNIVLRIKERARKHGLTMYRLAELCREIVGGRRISTIPGEVAHGRISAQRAREMLLEVERWLDEMEQDGGIDQAVVDEARAALERKTREGRRGSDYPEHAVFAAVIQLALDDIAHPNPVTAIAAWRWWLVRCNTYRSMVFAFAGALTAEAKVRREALRRIVEVWPKIAKRARGKVSVARLRAFRALAERHLSTVNM